MKKISSIVIGLGLTIIFAMFVSMMDVPHRYVWVDERPPVFAGDNLQ